MMQTHLIEAKADRLMETIAGNANAFDIMAAGKACLQAMDVDKDTQRQYFQNCTSGNYKELQEISRTVYDDAMKIVDGE